MAQFRSAPPPWLVELDAPAPRAEVEAPEERERPRRVEALVGLPELGLVDHVLEHHPEYGDLRGQYASFGGSYPDGHFQPELIARPRNVDEIMTVVKYAIKNGKRVVTRSGGHQYCGFSSGGAGSVQIVMDFMHYMEHSTELVSVLVARGCSIVSSDSHGMQHFVSVAPSSRLQALSATLLANRLTIPHGECPLVGVGGHVQTGGYGHQMRGLGLCLDYVYSFDIVVCTASMSGGGDIAAPSVRQVTVYRPELQLSDDEAPGKDPELNDRLYKGVLGGSPGAFGVITRIKFLAVHDEDSSYSDSHNAMKIYPYRGRKVQKGVARIVRTMLRFASTPPREDPNGIAQILQTILRFASPPLPPYQPLCEGLDVFVTILSYKVLRTTAEWGMAIPELAYTGSDFSPVVQAQVNQILRACSASAIRGSDWLLSNVLHRGQDLAPRDPSKVADKGVRTDQNGVTALGREFDHPYKKRVNVMLATDGLSETDIEAFSKGFGALAADVVKNPDLLLVIQMNLGGGKAKTNDTEGRTGIPYRNQSFGFVFDVFYKNEAARLAAEDIQRRMQSLLDRVGGGCFNHRLFWGSFGRENGETDMSQANVQEWYYGTAKTAYKSMQAIKDAVDPNGTFTTEFTVQNTPRTA